MGYSHENKGYRCYNLATNELRMSRAIVFYEMGSWYMDVNDVTKIDMDVKYVNEV